nr:hypothetical protein [Stenotrophomonas geniculata]
MSNPTTIIDAFLSKGAQLFRERPFGPLPSPEEALDELPIPTLVYLRWLASTGALIDQPVGSTIARSDSPMELVANLQAAFHGEIPGNALSEDALDFTVEYFSPRATFLSDFFSLFPQDATPSPDAMWDKQEQVYAIIDSRLQSWRNGEPIVRAVIPSADQQGHAEPATPLDADVWITTLATLSDAAVTQEGSWAYADHFYRPLTKPPSVEVVLAVMREFLRDPPHDASIMTATDNFLSDIPLALYIKAYSILAPELLDRSSDAALNLFDFPGCELTPRQIRQFIKELRRCNPGRDVVGELAQLAIEWDSEDDETFSIVIEAAQKQG